MNITPLEIELALSSVIEPEENKNIISLSMLQDIQIQDLNIKITLALPSADYPFATKLKQDCVNAIKEKVGKELRTEIVFTVHRFQNGNSPTSKIKKIVAVASGKGGVGKSTIAAQLAVALAENGNKAALFDADIYGPSVPTLFNINKDDLYGREENGKTIFIPIEREGIKLMSIGFLVPEDIALIWRGPMASNTLKQLFNDTDWGELDYLVVDFPPGTGDIQLTLSHLLPIDGVIMVSTPQQLSIVDVKRAFNMFQEEKSPISIIGLVENMSYFISEHDNTSEKQYIFGENGGKQLAEELSIPLLSEIPILPKISIIDKMENSHNFSNDSNVSIKEIFSNLARIVTEKLSN